MTRTLRRLLRALQLAADVRKEARTLDRGARRRAGIAYRRWGRSLRGSRWATHPGDVRRAQAELRRANKANDRTKVALERAEQAHAAALKALADHIDRARARY